MKSLLTLFISAFILINSSWAADRPSNEIPMYGGADKSHIEPDVNSSKGLAQLGWQYFAKGDYDTAIKRFNQAWMFNHSNIEALWGFGLIMSERSINEEPEKNLKESIKFLEMAQSLSPENSRIISDLAYTHAMLGNHLKGENKNPEKAFSKAEELFLKATDLEPDLGIIWGNWSILKFFKGEYQEAKDTLEKAKKLGYKPQLEYEKELKEKL